MADALLGTLDRLLEEHGVPFLSRQSRGQVLVLAPLAEYEDRGEVLDLAADIAGAACMRLRTGRIDAGVSSALSGLHLVPRAAGQARLALRHAGLVGGDDCRVVAFDGLGRRYQVLDSLPDQQLQDLADAVVGRLAEVDREGHSELLKTLEAYLACGGAVAEAATQLYVHRNTLRKRVARIEEALGVDLGTSGGRTEAYLGVRARDVLATRRG
jgi:DNA-binding PucR family transcriptional regulator